MDIDAGILTSAGPRATLKLPTPRVRCSPRASAGRGRPDSRERPEGSQDYADLYCGPSPRGARATFFIEGGLKRGAPQCRLQIEAPTSRSSFFPAISRGFSSARLRPSNATFAAEGSLAVSSLMADGACASPPSTDGPPPWTAGTDPDELRDESGAIARPKQLRRDHGGRSARWWPMPLSSDGREGAHRDQGDGSYALSRGGRRPACSHENCRTPNGLRLFHVVAEMAILGAASHAERHQAAIRAQRA